MFPLRRFRFTPLPPLDLSVISSCSFLFPPAVIQHQSDDSGKGGLARVGNGCDQLGEMGKSNHSSVSFSSIFSQVQLFTFKSPAGFQKLRLMNLRNADGSLCHHFADGKTRKLSELCTYTQRHSCLNQMTPYVGSKCAMGCKQRHPKTGAGDFRGLFLDAPVALRQHRSAALSTSHFPNQEMCIHEKEKNLLPHLNPLFK